MAGELVDITCGENQCSTEGSARKECFPIHVPQDETDFFPKPCILFVRSGPFMRDDCDPGKYSMTSCSLESACHRSYNAL